MKSEDLACWLVASLALAVAVFTVFGVVAVLFAIAFPNLGKPFQSPVDECQRESASRDAVIDAAVEEAMSLRKFDRKRARDELRTLGFSDNEIGAPEYFFSLAGESSDVLRMPPQQLVDYLLYRLEDEKCTAFLFEGEALGTHLRQLNVHEQKSFRDAVRLL